MIPERALQRLDDRIRAIEKALEIAYATLAPDERKDALHERLEALLWTRLLLRQRWSEVAATEQMLGPYRRALQKLARHILEKAKPFLDEHQRLEKERQRSRPAFWRAYCPADDARLAGSLVDDRRPLWGYRRKVGRR